MQSIFTRASSESTHKPWLSRREWTSPVIKSQAKAGLWVVWIFAIFWNAIAIPLGVSAMDDILSGDTKALIALLFPLAGLGLLAWAIVATRSYRRFGQSPLTLDPYPGAIGGQVGGTIDLQLPYDHTLNFKSVLTCAYSYMSGSGKERKRSERVVWQSEGYAHTRSYGGKTRLEVLFDVDDELPAADCKKRGSYHLWRLRVNAKLPGADFDRSYELPVFPTGENAQQLRELSTEHSMASQERMEAIENVLDLQQVPGGVELYYPAFRHPAGKIAGIVLGFVFIAAGIFIGYSDGPLIFPIVFPLLGALVAAACAYKLFLSLRVRLDEQYLQTEKRMLGRRVGGQKIPRGELRGLGIKQSYSSSNGREHTVYYKLQALTHSGKAVDVGYNLPGRETALQALESLSMLTGVPCENSGKEQGRATA